MLQERLRLRSVQGGDFDVTRASLVTKALYLMEQIQRASNFNRLTASGAITLSVGAGTLGPGGRCQRCLYI